jgi:hypothetical protein
MVYGFAASTDKRKATVEADKSVRSLKSAALSLLFKEQINVWKDQTPLVAASL